MLRLARPAAMRELSAGERVHLSAEELVNQVTKLGFRLDSDTGSVWQADSTMLNRGVVGETAEGLENRRV